MAYATVDDLAARWKELSSAEEDMASALLDDAAVMLRAIIPDLDARLADERLDADVLSLVSCRMVRRAMSAPAGFEGVSAFNQGAGPFSQSVSFANPSGEMWVSRAERRMLGLGGGGAFTVDLLGGGG